MAQKAIIYGNAGAGAKSGRVTLSASETKTIKTGLASIKRFVMLKIAPDSGTLYHTSVNYDAEVSTAKYGQSGYNGSSAFGASPDVGTNSDAVRFVKINSVSGGDVSITAPSSSSYCGELTWYAE